nr:hypothetical protein [Agromyces sp. ISL-38]
MPQSRGMGIDSDVQFVGIMEHSQPVQTRGGDAREPTADMHCPLDRRREARIGEHATPKALDRPALDGGGDPRATHAGREQIRRGAHAAVCACHLLGSGLAPSLAAAKEVSVGTA